MYAGFLADHMMAHELGPDGQAVRSFGEAPPLDGVEGLGPVGATLARRRILAGRLYCDDGRGQVIVAGSSHPVIRSYDTTGTLRWQVTLADITPVGFAVDRDGSVVPRYDQERGADFVKSMLAWDDRSLLVQYEVRLPGERPATREFNWIDSRVISLDDGAEIARRSDLPLLAAGRGDRFVILDNLPYPRALIVRRRPTPPL